jgi:hypothetical protein
MSKSFKRGHCLHCDLAAAVNAWSEPVGVTPHQLIEDLTGVLAYAAVAVAKPGQLINACELAAELTLAKARAIAAGDIDRGSHHAAGHS